MTNFLAMIGNHLHRYTLLVVEINFLRAFCRVVVPAVIFSSTSIHSAAAASIALREGSTDWMANAFAGETAKAYDASTVFSNPAGMTRLIRNEIDVSFGVVAPSSTFNGSNTIGGRVTLGSQGGNYAQPFVVPSAFAVWNSSSDLKFGIAMSAPFGARLAYSDNFVGRYQSLVSSVSDVQISLAAAYRINEHFSVGAGPVINYLGVRLTQAVNIGQLSSTFGDPIADFNGRSVGAGFAIGALYEFDDSFRMGIAYRSRVQATVTGTQSIAFAASLGAASPATAAALSASNGSANARLSLPDSLSVGLYKEIDERWSVMADLQWTDWSLVKTLVITPANHLPATVLSENWHNTWFGAVGVNFRPLKRLLLQAGVGYDLSPVNNDNRTTRVPDANRFLVGGGVTYGLLTNVNLQFAVLQALSAAATIDDSASATAGVIRGVYHSRATLVSVGVTAQF